MKSEAGNTHFYVTSLTEFSSSPSGDGDSLVVEALESFLPPRQADRRYVHLQRHQHHSSDYKHDRTLLGISSRMLAQALKEEHYIVVCGGELREVKQFR